MCNEIDQSHTVIESLFPGLQGLYNVSYKSKGRCRDGCVHVNGNPTWQKILRKKEESHSMEQPRSTLTGFDSFTIPKSGNILPHLHAH